MLWKRVRELNSQYENDREFLQKEYVKGLKELQSLCTHEKNTRWEYKIDTYGEVASTAEGVLFKYRECLDCGLMQAEFDNKNDYNSELAF